MSEHQEESAHSAEPEHIASDQGEKYNDSSPYIKDMTEALEQRNCSLGEVPQSFLMDPSAFLPLNTDRLMVNGALEKLIADTNLMVQGEIDQIQRLHKKISFWEDKIAKNRMLMDTNRACILKNTSDIAYDRKNRDYWLGRAELVHLDYRQAEAAGHTEVWRWLIKKWGLKNPDGTVIDPASSAAERLCIEKSNHLAEEYRTVGNRYEQAKKEKEAQNYRLIRENTRYLQANDTLQKYIAEAYSTEIEPCQDGVLLLKELSVKLKTLEKKAELATYGELRSWADGFLNDFLKSNPRVSFSVVTEFRKIASIPLPGENC
ncbi:MAG: hypothetical protein Q8L98_03815 [Chlamydiales bacterium]|nr:hypothetical protein [Chlamydiales bacterium]